ncbi:hypothetical protein KBX50_22070 [Micromonospora sp. C51]|uniref:hypothetical protein n=1 Tax=Micromonospora sp. C51 TaxID=2824879 RepID=UPI001B371163|nr:hypothetical protein [Micromonospora sp. C51]MBQ1051145.1 hypothetical protein [Micromonospora sp. C51]
MDVQTAQILRGFLMLNSFQQDEFVRTINDVMQGRKTSNKAFSEAGEILRVNTGPVMSACGCCGR